MPLGSRHTLVGMMQRGSGLLPVLRVDGGGTWRLDLNPRNWTYIGQRVRVTGVRGGFDLLDVVRVEAL